MSKKSMFTVFSFIFVFIYFVGSQAVAQSGKPPKCQILDHHDNPLYEFGFRWTPAADVGENGKYGSTSLIKIYGLMDGGYYRDILDGDIHLSFYGGAILPSGRTDLHIPRQLVDINANIEWTYRTLSATAFQATFKPGIYSDLEVFSSSALFMPFSMAVIQSFSDDLSGILGVDIRPSFDLVAMPIVGLVWKASPDVRVEATLPVAKISWDVDELWTAYCGFDWVNKSYDIGEKRGLNAGDGGQITIEDFSIYAGAERELNDFISIVGEIGSLFNRSISFSKDVDPSVENDVDVDNSLFLRLAVRGAF